MPDRSSVLDPRPAQTDKRMAHLDANAFLRPDNHPRPRSMHPLSLESATRRRSLPSGRLTLTQCLDSLFLVGICSAQLCGAVLHCCIYAWSVLNHPRLRRCQEGPCSKCLLHCHGCIWNGSSNSGPPLARWAVSIGTTLFLIGHIVTALGIHYKAIAGIYIGYGIITAIGLGMCYTSPVSTLQKWFPDYRGTAAGFAVAGSGAGSSCGARRTCPPLTLLASCGCSSCSVLSWALRYSLLPWSFESCPVIFLSRLNIDGNVANVSEGMEEKLSTAYKAVQTPTGADKPETVAAPKSPIKPLTLKQAVFTPDYIFMYLMFFANQLCCVSRLSSMCTDIFAKSANTASDIVSGNSVFNCCGRLAFSAISDFLVLTSKWRRLADGMSVGEAYIDNIQVIFVIVCIGFVVLFLVRTNAKDRFEPGYHYSLCGKRVISIPPKEKDAMNQQEAEEAAAEKLPETAV
ncbi:Major facilitator superfamily domain [Phytophthora cactorum]|nr:Major facilitator superfamily domain [Phytophthora cactorum]